MRKDTLIVDWLLVIVFVIMILSRFIIIPFAKIIQPIFLGLILIHVIQHWRYFYSSIKKISRK